jgi:hypothetical protein
MWRKSLRYSGIVRIGTHKNVEVLDTRNWSLLILPFTATISPM